MTRGGSHQYLRSGFPVHIAQAPMGSVVQTDSHLWSIQGWAAFPE